MAHMIDADIQTEVPLRTPREQQVFEQAVKHTTATGKVPDQQSIANHLPDRGVSADAVAHAQRRTRNATTSTNARTMNGEPATTQGLSQGSYEHVVATVARKTIAERQERRTGKPTANFTVTRTR